MIYFIYFFKIKVSRKSLQSIKKVDEDEMKISKLAHSKTIIEDFSNTSTIFVDSFSSQDENKENQEPKTPPRSIRSEKNPPRVRKARSSRRVSRVFSLHMLDDSIYEQVLQS